MLFTLVAAVQQTSGWQTFSQQCLIGLTLGSMYALIALGYTMVYGIIGLINFAHGDLFMLGAMLTTTLLTVLATAEQGVSVQVAHVGLLLVIVPIFCAGLNLAVDRIVYKPLRNAPKLAPLVSAIGVSFIFMNIGLFWSGASDRSVPSVVSTEPIFDNVALPLTYADVMQIAVVLPIMVALALFVKYSKLGTAMRATAQNPVASQLMGIHVERVIGATFVIGGALAGVASVIYCLYLRTVGFQMGYQNGLYAFTAAVLGGIGSIPGAVLGGLIIGLVASLAQPLVGAQWSQALVYAVLIAILVFRPAGLLGAKTREKV